ncbi:NCA2-domain-containing protein [Eremomyces bilateralis CBS 781.70]|uniref:NCA2-domain-containing protein n=1 Tax=Eremomyces bilateralis CBS 781.70 TaxID=1392243 RepID=A0A6G1G486_9PEZI|nr:NCA2-domain-containing protein [Eremomyces bilateralis CBS 781.70]KAF1812897.1 NCA2-domain-containing protein [Eremomyces bilateralis CBS 781.70]
MSFVLDQVQRIDAQLDRLQLSWSQYDSHGDENAIQEEQFAVRSASAPSPRKRRLSDRTSELQALVKALSHSPSHRGSLIHHRNRIVQALKEASRLEGCRVCQREGLGAEGTRSDLPDGTEEGATDSYASSYHRDHEENGRIGDEVWETDTDESLEHDLEWLLLAKATNAAYGIVLDTILENTIPLSEHLYYFDDVLSSYRYTALFAVQMTPLRLFHSIQDVYGEVARRIENITTSGADQSAQAKSRRRSSTTLVQTTRNAVNRGWSDFYTLVRSVVRERNMRDWRKQLIGPLMLARGELAVKRKGLQKLRVVNANALGVLLGEGLSAGGIHTPDPSTLSAMHPQSQPHFISTKWKSSTAKTIALLDAVLGRASDATLSAAKFDDAIASATQEDPYYDIDFDEATESSSWLKPLSGINRLLGLLENGLPAYQDTFNAAVMQNGRPPRWVRYWPIVTVGILSSGTVLRILTNRRAEIVQWLKDSGTTAKDFWNNWVIAPIRNVIGTIRHDEDSEVSIMSKRSLEGDRDSLERMVVEFAVDNAKNSSGSRLSDTEIADMRVKVREGDLTPVLKAYERDMRSPLWGTVRGELVRTLLIQVQKTKVDVEVAIGGIDSLLKSQELVFGFVGLTPGLFVCFGVFWWLSSAMGNRSGIQQRNQKGQMVKELRNIDRILTSASSTGYGELFYKDHGLLLCEVHVLRQTASATLPKRVLRDFLEELEDLVDIRTGVERQKSVVKRIAWAYANWL